MCILYNLELYICKREIGIFSFIYNENILIKMWYVCFQTVICFFSPPKYKNECTRLYIKWYKL